MPSLIQDSAFAAGIADIVKAVGHPARLRIIALLCRNDATVTEIARVLDLAPAIVSQQLRILRLSNLVGASRADGFALYRLAEPRLANLVECLEGCTLHGRRAATAIAEASIPGASDQGAT